MVSVVMLSVVMLGVVILSVWRLFNAFFWCFQTNRTDFLLSITDFRLNPHYVVWYRNLVTISITFCTVTDAAER